MSIRPKISRSYVPAAASTIRAARKHAALARGAIEFAVTNGETMNEFVFEPRLERASTLPASYYTDPSTLEREQRNVFARTWQLVGRMDQLEEPGSYFTATVAGEPVIVCRGKDGVVRALSNVCRHRAGPVSCGSGRRPALQCGYHGWTYSLEGKLLATPEFDGVENFDRTLFSLPEFRVETVGPLVFVNLEGDAPPLGEVLGEIAPLFASGARASYRLAAKKDWELDCNWKVYVDNYLEGYHIPIVHPALFRELDYARYRTETARWYSEQHSPVKKPVRIRVTSDQPDARYFWVYPNLMINVYADNFSTNVIIPSGHRRTLTVFEWYFPESAPKKIVDETVTFSDEIQLEDISICEAVQRGLESRTYSAGRYSVARENGVHHFHGLYWEGMAKDEGDRR
jgi:choline monooxygenase